MVPLEGLETPTRDLGRRRSIQLSYRGMMVEIGGREPTSEANSAHSTIPDALRPVAHGFIRLANALESEGGPLLNLAPVLHGLSNGRHSNRDDRPNP